MIFDIASLMVAGNPNQGQTPIKITFLDGVSKIGGYRWHDKDVMCILDYDTGETINIRMEVIRQWIFEPAVGEHNG